MSADSNAGSSPSATQNSVVRVDGSVGVEEPLALDPARLLPGSPAPGQRVRNSFTDTSGQFFAGEWRSGVGAWHVRYTENEMCVLTEGRVRLTATQGTSWTFGPGECFVIPAGFEGLWEVLEPAHKFYAIFEAGSR